MEAEFRQNYYRTSFSPTVPPFAARISRNCGRKLLAAIVRTSKGGEKEWQTTPMNLPRMQRARAKPVTWLGSGSSQARPSRLNTDEWMNAVEIIEDHQCGFWCIKSTNHILCIFQILGKNWEYNEAVHQLFIDFNKGYDSVRRKVLSDSLIEFGISVKLVRLIKMCLTELYSRVLMGMDLPNCF